MSEDTAYDELDKEKRQADRGAFGKIRLQDASVTEGYDVIPNFFISAFVDKERKYVTQEDIKGHPDPNNPKRDKEGKIIPQTYISQQFPDRLFDRDTLILSHYDVNFLYVIYLYARDKASEKAQWKDKVRRIFRNEIRSVIQKQFEIYAMRARLGVDGTLYLQQHFYDLNGRVFQPYGEKRMTYFAYARPTKNLDKTQAQYDELEKYFVIKKCGMGEDPQEVLKGDMDTELKKPLEAAQWLTLHYLERYKEKGVLVGYYKDKEHLQWILGHNDKGTLVYNVRLQVKGEEPRPGSHPANFYSSKNIQFVILYTDDAGQTGNYRVFHVKDTASKVTEERMRETWYPFEVKGPHFFFRFDEEVNLGKLRIADILKDLKIAHLDEFGSYTEGEPLFTTAEKLKKFRDGF